MRPANDNSDLRFMPKPDPWRRLWLALVFSVPISFAIALVRIALGLI
jgi:hypothetical protein